MTSKELRLRYFSWMFSKIWPSTELIMAMHRSRYYSYFCWIDDFEEEPLPYQEIELDELDRIFFRYDPRIQLDEDRMTDGLDLRDRFLEESGYPALYKSRYMDIYSCTVLEVLVALSLRCDSDIIGDPDRPGLTAPLIFWTMLKNLRFRGEELSDETSIRRSVDYRCDIFMDREYSYYGDGGPFRVENPMKSMKKTDLWMQLNWFLTENFGTNSVI